MYLFTLKLNRNGPNEHPDTLSQVLTLGCFCLRTAKNCSLKRWRSDRLQKRKRQQEKLVDLDHGAGKGWETWVFHEVRDKNIYEREFIFTSLKERLVQLVTILIPLSKILAFMFTTQEIFSNLKT